MHRNWRDCQEWKRIGLPLSSTSNEAVKLYDASVTQFIGCYDDDMVGGMSGSVTKMLEADPEFVMGHVLVNALHLVGIGRSPKLDTEFQQLLNQMVVLADTATLTSRERLHVKAVKLLGEGYVAEACEVWEEILQHHPLDILATKLVHDFYIYLGYLPQMRDSTARVLAHWKPDMPLYGYLLGLHAFGLMETNLFDEAEQFARKGLEINPRDGWSTHSLAHVFEMQGRQDEGISLMSSAVAQWSTCSVVTCHNYWHWAVFHIEKGEYDAALDIYDREVGPRANKSGAIFNIVDSSSLLYRLEMEQVAVGERWQGIYNTCRPHAEDHLMSYNDAHFLMSYLGAKDQNTAKKLMDSIKLYLNDGNRDTYHKVCQSVGLSLCEAILAYGQGAYDTAVDTLYPIRYKVIEIGGSNAQRDVFSQLLIHACFKSSKSDHHKLARHLLAERKALKVNSPLTDRLIAKAATIFED